MKKIILICTIISYAYASNAQLLKDTIQNLKLTDKELGMQYLKKGKSQKTIGAVLVVGGAVLGTIGLAVSLHGFAKGFDWRNPQRGESDLNSGTALAVTGGVMFVAGVPFVIMGGKNEKRGKLLLSRNTISMTPQMPPKKMLSVGVAINF